MLRISYVNRVTKYLNCVTISIRKNYVNRVTCSAFRVTRGVSPKGRLTLWVIIHLGNNSALFLQLPKRLYTYLPNRLLMRKRAEKTAFDRESGQ